MASSHKPDGQGAEKCASCQPKNNTQGAASTKVRAIILLAIVCVIAGIFVYKSSTQKASNNDSGLAYALDATYTFDLEETLALGLPTVVDFGADSCVPCKEMAPILKELNAELQGKAIVNFVDVWKNQQASGSLPIDLIPAQFFWNADGSPFVPPSAMAGMFKIHTDQATGKHVLTSREGQMTKEEILLVLGEMGVKP